MLEAADRVLCFGTGGSMLMAKIAQLIVMDVLFQEYCARNHKQCEENTEAIAAALSAMHL